MNPHLGKTFLRSFFLSLSAIIFLAISHSQAKNPSVIRFRMSFEPQTLDWTLGDVPIWVIQNSMRGLYRVDPRGRLTPDLLQAERVRDQGKTWIFKIRSGVLWSDGQPLVAQHFVDSWQRLLNPNTGTSYSYLLGEITQADQIRAIDARTIELKLTRSAPDTRARLSHWVTDPVRLDLIHRYTDYGTNPKHMAFLGPYQIVEWKRDSKIQLKAHPYAGQKNQSPKPLVSELEGWLVLDNATAVNLFDTGKLDLVGDLGSAALNRKDVLIKTTPILYFIAIHRASQHPLTRSVEGIAALSLALRRSEIPQALGVPHRPTLQVCPAELCPFLQTSAVDSRLAALKAKDFLKEAGIEDPTKLPTLHLAFYQKPMIKDLAEWLQAQWSKHLGIKVELESEEPKTYWSTHFAHPTELMISSKGAAYPDGLAYFSIFESANPQNLGKYKNTHFDEILVKARTQSKPSKKEALIKSLNQEVTQEDPALIPLFFGSNSYLIRPGLKDLVINPLSSVYFDQAHF